MLHVAASISSARLKTWLFSRERPSSGCSSEIIQHSVELSVHSVCQRCLRRWSMACAQLFDSFRFCAVRNMDTAQQDDGRVTQPAYWKIIKAAEASVFVIPSRSQADRVCLVRVEWRCRPPPLSCSPGPLLFNTSLQAQETLCWDPSAACFHCTVCANMSVGGSTVWVLISPCIY